MKFFEYPDGSRSKYYEPGDMVVLKRDHFSGAWRTDVAGTVGTVRRVDNWSSKKPSTVAFLEITSAEWGIIKVPQWDVEPTERTLATATRLENLP